MDKIIIKERSHFESGAKRNKDDYSHQFIKKPYGEMSKKELAVEKELLLSKIAILEKTLGIK